MDYFSWQGPWARTEEEWMALSDGGVCETGGESSNLLARVPSLPHTVEKEIQTLPTSSPKRTEQQGTDTQNLEREI